MAICCHMHWAVNAVDSSQVRCCASAPQLGTCLCRLHSLWLHGQILLSQHVPFDWIKRPEATVQRELLTQETVL